MSIILQIIRGGTTYTVNGGNPFWLITMQGIGIPPNHRLTDRGPFQHGSSDLGFLLDERTITLAWIFQADTDAEMDSYRDLLTEILKPVEEMPLKLRVTRDDGKVREIVCDVDGAVDMPNTPVEERMGPSQKVVASLKALDPVWYNPALKNLLFTNASNRGFHIPMMVPWAQTPGSVIDAVQSVTYAGSWEEYPTIYITGPAEDVVITNQTTGHVLDFTGATIGEGETYTISLAYGEKTIISDVNGNRFQDLTADSDWAEWHLAPAPKAPGGVNDIRVQVPSGASDATRVRMTWYERYLSL